ncbi:MAG: glycosyltransferase family 4 protein [Pseudomonadota bacterium]
MPQIDPRTLDVIAPNFKRRMSGVSSTVYRLIPIQAKDIAIASSGPRLPQEMPQVSATALLTMSKSGPSGRRIWHARRNTEMLVGLFLRRVLRKKLRLLFTSAAQRRHTGYTRWLLGQMDAIVATSGKAASYLDHTADVIHHGIDTQQFAPVASRAEVRRRLNLPADPVLVGCFGRIRAQKGTDLFVDAMLRLLPDRPGAMGIIMGGVTSNETGFADDLRARIAAAGLSDRLHILPEDQGFSIAPWFQAMDLYVAPQRWEGFGLTPLEAMACGLPVVATRVGAFEEIVLDDETGRLVPADDVDALTGAIGSYLDDADTRASHGVAARARAASQFRIEDEAAALNAVYRKLLNS